MELIQNSEEQMIEVLVFASNSASKPKIVVPMNATRKDLENAIKTQTELSTSNLVWQDGLKATELSSNSSILSNQGGKGLLYLTPKNNKAGMANFKFYRNEINFNAEFKTFVVESVHRFNKDNWTRLSSRELEILYNEYNQDKTTEVVETAQKVVSETTKTEVQENSNMVSNDITEKLDTLQKSIDDLPQLILKITNNINEEQFEKALKNLMVNY